MRFPQFPFLPPPFPRATMCPMITVPFSLFSLFPNPTSALSLLILPQSPRLFFYQKRLKRFHSFTVGLSHFPQLSAQLVTNLVTFSSLPLFLVPRRFPRPLPSPCRVNGSTIHVLAFQQQNLSFLNFYSFPSSCFLVYGLFGQPV